LTARRGEQALEARLVELEMRVSFQEQALAELSDALADARMQGMRNADVLRVLLEDLGKVRNALLPIRRANRRRRTTDPVSGILATRRRLGVFPLRPSPSARMIPCATIARQGQARARWKPPQGTGQRQEPAPHAKRVRRASPASLRTGKGRTKKLRQRAHRTSRVRRATSTWPRPTPSARNGRRKSASRPSG
jgi:SlyX protein